MAAGARHVVGDKELHTFTAGYGPDDRELVNAEMVARVLGTIHHPLVLSPGDLPGILPWMVWHLEEPIGREDIAYLYVAAREAARHVDVILAGFGFDGLFAGLPRHRLVDLGLKIPPARGPLEEFYDYTFRSVEPRSLAGRALRQAYFRGKSYPAPHVVGACPLPPFVGFPKDADQPITNFLRRGFMLNPYQFAIEHLYSAVGVRMNAHHTNPAFIATAFSIPDRLKIHGRTQKYILRKACAGLLPDRMLAFGKSFNRLKHDTEMSDVLDRMADDLLPRAAVLARGHLRAGLRGGSPPPAVGHAVQPGARLPSLVDAADGDVEPNVPGPARGSARGGASAGAPDERGDRGGTGYEVASGGIRTTRCPWSRPADSAARE